MIIPTFNRADALRANLGASLQLAAIAEVIVVDDGSSDDTVAACAEFDEPRLRVLSHSRNRGVAAARNTGIASARHGWVLFGEDDCRFPADYAEVLMTEAMRLDADIVGAPWLNVAGSESEVAEYAARLPRVDKVTMDDATSFPSEALHTPFLPAPALIRSSVFDAVQFFEGFRVNGYREETDFFVQAWRAGFKCCLTPATFSYQSGRWSGGQHHASTLRYEYWAARNNWHFLRRHERWLIDSHEIRSAPDSQLAFMAARSFQLIRGATRARLARVQRLRSAGVSKG